MTQAVAQIRNTVSRSGFANPLTLGILVETASYVKVYADEELLVEGVDYIITGGVGSPDGVTIEIIGATDPNNYTGYLSFTALFDPPLDQQGDLSSGGILGRAFESALDQLNRRLQAVGDRSDRALKMGPDIDWSGVLPPPVDGTYPMWDADTQAFVWAALGTAAAQPLDVDLSAIAALNTTAYGRALLTLANQAALLALLPSYQPLDSDLTSWSAVVRATGFDAFVATPNSANLRALLTDETGTGANVFATAPTLQGATVTTNPLTMTSGQIKFPATQLPSTDVNTLDDYEEGTWTPVIEGTTTAGAGTYTTQNGTYTKIGKLVYVYCNVNWTAHTGTGNLRISGFPFANGNADSVPLPLLPFNLTYTQGPPVAYMAGGASNADIRSPQSGGAPASVAMDTSAAFNLSGCYLAP